MKIDRSIDLTETNGVISMEQMLLIEDLPRIGTHTTIDEKS
jgi:hypothetical protein